MNNSLSHLPHSPLGSGLLLGLATALALFFLSGDGNYPEEPGLLGPESRLPGSFGDSGRYFEENLGQLEEGVRFLARSSEMWWNSVFSSWTLTGICWPRSHHSSFRLVATGHSLSMNPIGFRNPESPSISMASAASSRSDPAVRWPPLSFRLGPA